MPIQVGEQVYVPRRTLGLDDNDIAPLYRTVVRARQGRSVQVDLPNGQLSQLIGTSKISRGYGILVIRIGDFNEEGLLDPLAKSILHYCRMLLPGDSVRLIELRTEDELTWLWTQFHGLHSQVVLIGHGSDEGFQFGNGNVSPARLAEIFSAPQPLRKEFISLGCKTGYASFGREFSRAPCVSHYLAPFHSIHGCVGSLFTKTYLHERLLATRTPKVAFNHTRESLVGAATFRLWHNGRQQ